MKKYILLLFLILPIFLLGSVKTAYAAGCNVCATWNSDCQNKSLTCNPPGGAAGSGTDCTNTCTSWRWDDPCGSTGETRSVWHVCVLDCNRSPSDPKCGSCNLNSQYLTPDLGATCTNCIANSTSSTGWNARGAITYVKGSMGTAYAACTDQQVVNYMCNGGVSTENKNDCLSKKNGVCASSCGGSGSSPVPTSAPTLAPRPSLCQSMSISGNVLSPNNSLTITSTAKENNISKFLYAFYNTDNLYPDSGTPKPFLINGSQLLKYEIPTTPTNTFTTTIPYSYTDQPDSNWNNQKPRNIQVNGYFFKEGFQQSLPEVACTVSFNIQEQKPTPTPAPTFTTKFRIAENPTDLKTASWQDYTTVVESTPFDYPIKDIAPGVKTIFVEFMDSTGKTGGCGNNQNQPCQKQIKLLGPDPAMTGCSLSFEGNNAILNLTGQNFGSDKGTVKSGDSDLQIKSWKDGSIQAVLQNAPTGQVLPVTFTNTDGQTGTGQCSSISQLSLGAKVFCRAPASYDTDNVDLVLVDETGKKMRQTVRIDKNGVVQGLTQRLEDGKKYVLSLKAPKSLRRNAAITAGGGTVSIPNFILPIGDIFPLDGGDGAINAPDKAELNREWNIAGNATGRLGDFNQDGRINSIDWACMRYDYGQVDASESIVAPSPAPNVSPSPSASSSASPSP